VLLDEISELIEEKKFSDERVDKALEWYGAFLLEELTVSQANNFIMQLRKIKDVE